MTMDKADGDVSLESSARVELDLNQFLPYQVCAYTNMDKARVSRAIQSLEDRGLISRTPSQQDQRLHDLQLTDAGQALLNKLVPEAQAWEAGLVSTLSVGEYRDLLNTMRKLERQLERIG